MQLIKNPHWQILAALRQVLLSRPATSVIEKHQACGITLDLSRQQVTPPILNELLLLAKTTGLAENIEALFMGKPINFSEKRPALHTALRDLTFQKIWVDDDDICLLINKSKQAMYDIADKIRNRQWLGSTGKSIIHVVNIGIGGSDLSLRFCLKALDNYKQSDLTYHFISDADPLAFKTVVQHLNPEQTLFIIASKSFTTPETCYNFKKAKQWIGEQPGWDRHFIGVTAHCMRAYEMGLKHVIPIWEWVGGRFAVTSAINLITAIAIGPDAFQQFLSGAHAMDDHFRKQPFSKNLPVLAALVGIWNNNFLQTQQHLILTYGESLTALVPYVQQLDMESNGKSVDIYGHTVSYATGPVVWGGPGNQAQHSYYQLLCQGTHRVAIELVSIQENNHELLNKMCQNKNDILYYGVQCSGLPSERIGGGIPLTHIQLEKISPYILGACVAFYEQKVFTQATIWGINPFDQPGVESAKKFLQGDFITA